MNDTINQGRFGAAADDGANRPVEPVRVDVQRREIEPGARAMDRLQGAVRGLVEVDLETDLERVRRLAKWLDAKFSVAGFRFGLDSVIGLIPVVGDTTMTLIGFYPLMVARRHKLGKRVQAKIVGNMAVDWVVGLVPLVGDLFDVGYKANLRNLRLIEEAAMKRGYVPPQGGPAPVVPGEVR
jgi:hypothetical protein